MEHLWGLSYTVSGMKYEVDVFFLRGGKLPIKRKTIKADLEIIQIFNLIKKDLVLF